ncbi:unnamed protein product, partial [Cyprideis torosa]
VNYPLVTKEETEKLHADAIAKLQEQIAQQNQLIETAKSESSQSSSTSASSEQSTSQDGTYSTYSVPAAKIPVSAYTYDAPTLKV